MNLEPQTQVTQLLHKWQEGNQEALEALMPLVYSELKRLAGSYLRRERPHHTLQSATLVNEAYLRLVNQTLLPAADAAIARDGLADRSHTAACNFFASVPSGGDLYFMKNIVHDWADEPTVRLLKNIREVIPSGGKLLLAEAVLGDSPAPHFGKFIDIEMIAFVGGKERTAAEFRELLHLAGFLLRRVIPTRSPLSLMEADLY